MTAVAIILWLLGARLMYVADHRDIFAAKAPYRWLYLCWPFVAAANLAGEAWRFLRRWN